MRERVGIAPSLRWVSQRFAQRTLVGFFAEQWREFLIDAGTAVEHAAKAVVAKDDPTRLFTESDQANLTDAQLVVLRGRATSPNIAVADWDLAVAQLAAKHTIGARAAVQFAFELCGGRDDKVDANQILNVRNAAVHLGDLNVALIDDAAAALVRSLSAVWPSTGGGIRPSDMWGYLAPVATVDHVTTSRGSRHDAEVKIVLARQRALNVGQVAAHRRRQLSDHRGDATCPACGSAASRDAVPAATYATSNARADPHATVDVFDCLVFDLSLRGEQVGIVIDGT